jgi:hypothetical protein
VNRFWRAAVPLWLGLLLAVMALAPLAATAARGRPTHPTTLAPPGNPAVTEYLEDVPSAGGAAPPGGGDKPTHPLSAGQTKQLNHLGATGKLLVNVDKATAPQATASSTIVAKHTTVHSATHPVAGHHSQPAPEAKTDPKVFSGSSSGSVSAVISAATGQGGGGSGILLPILIAGGLLLVGLSVARRRRAR